MYNLKIYSLIICSLIFAFNSFAFGNCVKASLENLPKNPLQNIEKDLQISPYMENALQMIEILRFKKLNVFHKLKEVQNDPQIQTLIGNFYQDGKVYQ